MNGDILQPRTKTYGKLQSESPFSPYENPSGHTVRAKSASGAVPQAYINGRPIFRGMYEDNDPAKRLQVIVNYNTDISQYWEWSGTGLRPIDDTNEAYKLGVNYIVYGMTH